MAETAVNLTDRVRFRVGNKTGIDDRILSNLNKAIIHLIRIVKPQETVTSTTTTTSSGDYDYALASDVLAIKMVRDTTNDIEILQGSIQHFNRFKQDTSDSSTLGKPRRWTRIGNDLILYQKIPDDAYGIKYWYCERPTAMDSSNDFPLNDEWEDPVVELATAMTWRDLNAMDKAQLHYTAFQELIQSDDPEEIEDEAPEGGFYFVSNVYRM